MNLATPVAPEGPLYLYAITRAGASVPLELEGIGGEIVHPLATGGDIVALVSRPPKGRLRPQRRHIRAHHAVVDALMDESVTPLPFAFGTVVPDQGELMRFVEAHGQAFVDQLAYVQGCGEFSLRVGWDVENIFAHFVANEPSLTAMRDATFAGGQPSQDQLVELGRAFDRVRQARRDQVQATLNRAFAGIAREVRDLPLALDADAGRLVALVPHAEENRFHDAVDALAGQLPESLMIRTSGPSVPYSFVDLALEGA